jgi:two-component system OmpR family sensor kinase
VVGRRAALQEDDGPGIPDGEREAVFEPFYRLDRARQLGSGNAGLGLAIARQIVEAHGGTITLDRSTMGGARFCVRLPAAWAEPRAAGEVL